MRLYKKKIQIVLHIKRIYISGDRIPFHMHIHYDSIYLVQYRMKKYIKLI